MSDHTSMGEPERTAGSPTTLPPFAEAYAVEMHERMHEDGCECRAKFIRDPLREIIAEARAPLEADNARLRSNLAALREALLVEVREALTDLMGRQHNRRSVTFGDLIHWLDDLDLLQPLAPAAPEPAPVVEPPDPHRVEQRTKADCIRASLSSITGLNVPDFTTPFLGEKDIRPFGDSQTWLRSRGWLLLDDTGERPMPGYSLAIGPSPNIPNANHATVALDGAVIWDPSPHRDDPGRVFSPSGYWPVRRAPAAPEPAP